MADAQKEGKSFGGAVGKRRGAKGGGGGGGATMDMSGDLAAMSNSYSAGLMGAFSGVDISGAGYSQFLQTLSPTERIKADIKTTGAQLSQALLNQSAFGGLGNLIGDLQQRIADLTHNLYAQQQRESAQRLRNEEIRLEKYRQSEEKRNSDKEKADRELQATLITIGRQAQGNTYHLYGVRDGKEMIKIVEEEKRKNGINASGLARSV